MTKSIRDNHGLPEQTDPTIGPGCFRARGDWSKLEGHAMHQYTADVLDGW